jgi:hypothetical protein
LVRILSVRGFFAFSAKNSRLKRKEPPEGGPLLDDDDDDQAAFAGPLDLTARWSRSA